MPRLSNKQRILYERQYEEPIFMYLHPLTGLYNFGFVRLQRSCVHLTTSLRSLQKKGLISKTKYKVPLNMPTCPVKEAYIIKIKGGMSD